MIYIVHSGTASGSLRVWSERENAKLISFPGEQFDPAVAFASLPAEANGHPVVVLQYPSDTDEDMETIASFLRWVEYNPGHWYYAPRPNAYLSVEHAALAGIHSYQFVRPSLKERLRAVYAGMPGWVKPLLRPFGPLLAILSECVGKAPFGRSVSPAGEPAGAVDASNQPAIPAEPQVQVPRDLQLVGGDWREWEAPAPSLRRDLLDRPELFFPHPRGIHVIVLNKCNLKCVMCPYHSPTYKPVHKSDYFEAYRPMSPEVFSKIADYAGKNKIALQFGQIEEPLMHKGIVDFLREAKAKGVPYIHMTTNGTLLTREKADALVDSGLTSLMVSLDAANPETYKEIRGGDLAEVDANLSYLIAKAKPKGIKVWVSFILQPKAVAEREAFLTKWRALGADFITFYALSHHDHDTGELVGFQEMYRRGGERYPCASPWMQSVVFPDGEVSLCCRTMGLLGWTGVVDVGSLASASDFPSIWTGPQYKTVRQELIDNQFEQYPICRDCTIWSATTSLVENRGVYTRTYNETMETFEFQ